MTTRKRIIAGVIDAFVLGFFTVVVTALFYVGSEYLVEVYEAPGLKLSFWEAVPIVIAIFMLSRVTRAFNDVLDNPTAEALKRREERKKDDD